MGEHPLLGREVGNYRLGRLLGEGGMGAVFAAEHRFLGTRVAVKLLHTSYSSNPAVVQRFFQEAKASVTIAHPGVVKTLDFGQMADGALYLVMEFLEGRSLAAAIAERRHSEAETIRIGAAIADAIAAAHDKQIVHRDLKPDNVFLVDGTEVRVLDFGIAKLLTGDSSTKTGSILGTPQYMAPEQAKGTREVGPATDIYALGAILFEMLTQQPAFSGDFAEVIAKHLFDEPPKLRDRVAASEAMETLILDCLAKQPSARPPTMLALRDRLRAMSATAATTPGAALVSAARVAPVSTPAGRPITTLASAASEARSQPARRGSRVVVLGVGIGAIAVVAGLAWRPARAPLAAAGTAPAALPVSARPRPAPPVKVNVDSQPPGAEIYLDDELVGVTPTAIEAQLPHAITLKRPGYEATSTTITSRADVSVILTARPAAPAAAAPARPAAPRSKHAPASAAKRVAPPRPAASKPNLLD